jgi:uncharacterized membrane protein YhhN
MERRKSNTLTYKKVRITLVVVVVVVVVVELLIIVERLSSLHSPVHRTNNYVL